MGVKVVRKNKLCYLKAQWHDSNLQKLSVDLEGKFQKFAYGGIPLIFQN